MSDDKHTSPREVNPEVHHETSDINVRAIIWFFVIFIIFAIVTHVALWFLLRVFVSGAREAEPRPTTLVQREAGLPPEPRLQTDPRRDMLEMRRAERRVLTTYAWVDRERSVVRIPIEQAMKVVAEQGLPVRQMTAPSATVQPGTTAATAEGGTTAIKVAEPPVPPAASTTEIPQQ